MTDGVAIRMKREDVVKGDGFDVFIYKVIYGKIHPMERFEFKDLPEGVSIENTGVIAKEKAQDLLDDLWDAGIRPTRAVNNIGVIAAKDAHIAHLAEFLRLALTR